MSADEARTLMSAPGNDHLTWNTPLSEEHAARLIAACAPAPGARIADFGSGWGELLMRLVEAAPGSTGDGVETDPEAVARGRRLAGERGLTGRVRFHEVPAAEYPGAGYDLAVSIGSAHAWPGGTPEALEALRAAVRPGGRILLGDGFWEREPSAAALEGLGAEPGDFGTLLGLVRRAEAAGLRALQVTVADQREWDLFESAANIGRGERWALAHPGHPLQADVTAAVDARRTGYYGGYRGTLGLAYLVLSA
ncbi:MULTISPECIES: SAM-dependent methyltransferase [Streptomyces]|uniref:SAM-dependent methyltransferase n=1 Tax=Streptomyces TaxID=1883 RepID=UPI0006F8FE7D|nr:MULTISPECIES: class I SAM-dependent methyltransferase [Streptomyces]KQX81500.1 SAM-dependent methyltransferase [Streptomyces sp. Root1319]KQZ04224.1 SAM-dependent methyltransferase [Streptomyces sp. Root55]MDX3066779.1 class I SAM-dependent methyltransferase [Streptomyces sp. ND04-05B]RPK80168.1 Methyltransferase domain protein [Streptomyces sp. ADI97-07]WUC29522.1 class I SAM-dependent methyltransferase [Streptomyces clavifer]